MAKKQYFGLKYPFSNNDVENFEFDLNSSEKDKVASQILHLIFTPKGQRLRHPDFGTNLIQYIFEPNDGSTWSNVKQEIQTCVQKWINGVTINNIEVMADDEGNQIYVRIDYSVTENNYTYNNSIAVEL